MVELKVLTNQLRNAIAPLLENAPWNVAGQLPMVWDARGDAIVDRMLSGRPYFEPEMAAYLALVNPVNFNAILNALQALETQ